ncbi:hypothetical protein QR680_018052 [Steinernema hermaphroditum]|uniref:Uncharacterized protein n=1 Tax=Steinernema hermaphroditum TaxID=289476 RepID=A0AA39HGR6_9BILA|nr:hypothetical protein QR680_018052 [Steinernema hermaphroditum]
MHEDCGRLQKLSLFKTLTFFIGITALCVFYHGIVWSVQEAPVALRNYPLLNFSGLFTCSTFLLFGLMMEKPRLMAPFGIMTFLLAMVTAFLAVACLVKALLIDLVEMSMVDYVSYENGFRRETGPEAVLSHLCAAFVYFVANIVFCVVTAIIAMCMKLIECKKTRMKSQEAEIV